VRQLILHNARTSVGTELALIQWTNVKMEIHARSTINVVLESVTTEIGSWMVLTAMMASHVSLVTSARKGFVKQA
jgi:hypothetical protein